MTTSKLVIVSITFFTLVMLSTQATAGGIYVHVPGVSVTVGHAGHGYNKHYYKPNRHSRYNDRYRYRHGYRDKHYRHKYYNDYRSHRPKHYYYRDNRYNHNYRHGVNKHYYKDKRYSRGYHDDRYRRHGGYPIRGHKYGHKYGHKKGYRYGYGYR